MLLGALAAAVGAGLGAAANHVLSRRRQKSWGAAVTVGLPHPAWTPGMHQPSPHHNEWTTLDPDTLEKAAMYALTISMVVPRPVAFISSVDCEGNVNLAPYSYFNAVCHNPCTLVIGINHSPSRKDGKKDTLRNIEATGEFVVNLISEWFVEAANHTCGDFPPEVDEMKAAGLTPMPSTKVRPPRVSESSVHMECKLQHIYVVRDAAGNATCSAVFGTVVAVHVNSSVVAHSPSGKVVVDFHKLAPVARCGGVTYTRCTETYDVPRPNTDGTYGPAKAVGPGALPK